MNPDLRNVSNHMRGVGGGALAHANWHANYAPYVNDYWPELSVIQAAHAAEMFIKARIAEEHPLLIFEQVPKPTQVQSDLLEWQGLIEKGRTIQFSDLPHRLWATTGLNLPNKEVYDEVGRLRNVLQHFSSPSSVDLTTKSRDLIYKVIDPFINQCWGLYAVDYNEDDPPYEHLVETLIRNEVLFLVSPAAADEVETNDLVWPENRLDYRAEMEQRFDNARKET